MYCGVPKISHSRAPQKVGFDAHSADIRADIYSLGCTLYYLLTGQVLYPEAAAMRQLYLHLVKEPQPVGRFRNDVPRALDAIIQKMLAKDPENRFQIPAEVVEALAPFCDEHPPTEDARPRRSGSVAGGGRRGGRRPGRRFVWLFAVPFLIACLASWVISRPSLPVPNDAAYGVLFILPPTGLWYEDYGPVRQILEEGDVDVVVASSASVVGIHPAGGGQPVSVDLPMDDVCPEDYLAVVFVGGDNDSYLQGEPQGRSIKNLIDAMLTSKRYVAAICVGQEVLADAGALDGESAALSEGVSQQFSDRDIRWLRQPVVVSGHVVTGDSPESAGPFARALLRAVGPSP